MQNQFLKFDNLKYWRLKKHKSKSKIDNNKISTKINCICVRVITGLSQSRYEAWCNVKISEILSHKLLPVPLDIAEMSLKSLPQEYTVHQRFTLHICVRKPTLITDVQALLWLHFRRKPLEEATTFEDLVDIFVRSVLQGVKCITAYYWIRGGGTLINIKTLLYSPPTGQHIF